MNRLSLVLMINLLCGAQMATASGFVGFGTAWNTLALRPIDEEDSISYRGYSFDLTGGYQFFELMETKLNISLLKCRKGAAEVFDGDVLVSRYGAESGVRIDSSAYIGIIANMFTYETPSHHSHNELVGKWSGSEYGLKMAGTWKFGRYQLGEIGVKVTQVKLKQELIQRKLDTIALTMTYLLMGPNYF